jgi:hypothetical protein
MNCTNKYENEEYKQKQIDKFTKLQENVILETNKLQEQLQEDFKTIDHTNLVGEANKNILLYNKYSLLLFQKKNIYIKIERNKDDLESGLINYYKFDYDKSTKMTDSITDKFIKGNQMYASLLEFLKVYKNYLDLLERSLEICKDRGYAIKNIIEWKKIEFGMN